MWFGAFPGAFGLMRRTDSLEKTLMLGKIEGKRRSGWQRVRWLSEECVTTLCEALKFYLEFVALPEEETGSTTQQLPQNNASLPAPQLLHSRGIIYTIKKSPSQPFTLA